MPNFALIEHAAAADRAIGEEAVDDPRIMTLMNSRAYLDAQHPDHTVTLGQVTAFFHTKFPPGASTVRRPNAIVIDSGNPSAAPGRQFDPKAGPLNGGVWGPNGAPQRGGH